MDLGANAQMKLGRTMDDNIAYVEEHPDHILIQTDSVEGKTGDKLRLLNVMFVETGFQLALIYPTAAAAEEVDVLHVFFANPYKSTDKANWL